jgi:hypothetical protein
MSGRELEVAVEAGYIASIDQVAHLEHLILDSLTGRRR